VPRLYVFRYCFVNLHDPGDRLFSREHEVMVDGYARRFRWIHPENLEADEMIWSANADVVMSLHRAFGTMMVQVPKSSDVQIANATS
jgi:hypothetical protein